MEKRVDAALLLSFYGRLLTPRQQEMLRLYYEDDLSLSEIASLCGVTRQGAHDAIRKGEQSLFSFEEKLGLRAQWTHICDTLRASTEALDRQRADEARSLLVGLLDEMEAENGI